MKIEKIILFVCLFAPILISCQKEQTDDKPDSTSNRIELTAKVETVTTIGTRAPVATTFPNAGRISVIADAVIPDWLGLYFNDMEAVTTDVSPSSAYSFSWVTPQYWPLNGSSLALVAYSPKNSAIVPSGKTLNITLPAANNTMPDLLYGDGIQYGNKSAAYSNINFGVFKHAMSQLTVQVVTSEMGAPVVLNTLSITTKKNATLDLTNGSLVVSPTNNITYTYGSQPILSNNTTYTFQAATGVPFLLYPDVAGSNNTTIYVKFTDGAGTGNVLDYQRTLNVSDFLTTGGSGATLARAQQIVLTITVQGTRILNTELRGVIVPWVDKGVFGLTIE